MQPTQNPASKSQHSYAEINSKLWDTWTNIHVNSEMYDIEGFLNGKDFLKPIEIQELGDVSGKKLLHLQCHFGQDTLCWARRGAQVSGVDLSANAIKMARELSDKLGIDATFYNCNVYDTPIELNEQFDIVFTSYGTIGWLPDLDKWAAVIARCLKPGGTFYMSEFHPFVWMFDDETHEKITYGYFNTEMFIDDVTNTYADRNAKVEEKSATFNHPLSEIVNALINNGLQLQFLNEFNYSAFDVFPNSEEIEPGKFVMKHFGGKVPYMYSIKAYKY